MRRVQHKTIRNNTAATFGFREVMAGHIIYAVHSAAEVEGGRPKEDVSVLSLQTMCQPVNWWEVQPLARSECAFVPEENMLSADVLITVSDYIHLNKHKIHTLINCCCSSQVICFLRNEGKGGRDTTDHFPPKHRYVYDG